jgi:hypothetical protein
MQYYVSRSVKGIESAVGKRGLGIKVTVYVVMCVHEVARYTYDFHEMGSVEITLTFRRRNFLLNFSTPCI